MIVRRIVPDLTTDDFDACKAFYSDFLGLKLAMDLGNGVIVNIMSHSRSLATI